MADTSDRELRDALEAAQAEVKRLKAELSTREKAEQVAAREALERQLEALRAQVAELQTENAALRTAYGSAEKEQRTAFEAALRRAEKEAAQAREEVAQQQKRLEGLSRVLEKAEARAQRSGRGGKPASDSLWERLRGLFNRSARKTLQEELESARQENARLHQQLSRVQPRRRAR